MLWHALVDPGKHAAVMCGHYAVTCSRMQSHVVTMKSLCGHMRSTRSNMWSLCNHMQSLRSRMRSTCGNTRSHVDTLCSHMRSHAAHALVCPGKHVVDDGHELHDALVQVQVLQPLEQVGMLAPVRARHGDLLGLGLRRQDGHLQLKGLQCHGLWGRGGGG